MHRIKFKIKDPQRGMSWLRSQVSFQDQSNLDWESEDVPVEAAKIHRAAQYAAVSMGGVSCLPRSLAISKLLRQKGYEPKVVIGVSKSNDRLQSHAWVELAGVILGEPESVEADFQPVQI